MARGLIPRRPGDIGRGLTLGGGQLPLGAFTPPEPVFTPLDYSPLRAYHAPWDFDGSAPEDVISRWQNAGVVDNDPLETLTDWSPQEAHAEQAVGTKQARIRDGANGLFGTTPTYNKDGVDDAYNAGTLVVGAAGLTVFFVGAPSAAVKFIYEHGSNAASGSGSWMLGVPAPTVEFAVRYRRGPDSDNRRAQWVDGLPHVAIQRYIPGDPSPHRFTVDGVDVISSSSVSGTPVGDYSATLYLGARLAGTIAPYSGFYTSLWIFNELTDEQVTNVYNWLRENTGFT